jgi:hypothetical protein
MRERLMAGRESVETSDPDCNAKIMDAAFSFRALSLKDRHDGLMAAGKYPIRF